MSALHPTNKYRPSASLSMQRYCPKSAKLPFPLHGLRLIDIADPRRPREVGHFLPDVPEGSQRVQSNDVTTDDRGLFYLLDRLRGLTILERC
jgi:hypothetical protein